MDKFILSNATIADIDKRVALVLKELGNPEPPISHEMIRELLRLDKAYFQHDEPGLLNEVWSRLKRSTKQIVQRPGLIIDMLKMKSLRAAYVPDSKRIYIDETLHPFKKRWGETHECVHGLLPWHNEYMLGDDQYTLTQSCRVKLEAEANYGTGRLLFAGDRFNKEIADLPCSIDTVKSLSKEYGNSLTSALWRLVESTESAPICAYICPTQSPCGTHASDNNNMDSHFVRSAPFAKRFSNIDGTAINLAIHSYININARYNAGEKTYLLNDINGDSYPFHFKTINNQYSYLTLCAPA